MLKNTTKIFYRLFSLIGRVTNSKYLIINDMY